MGTLAINDRLTETVTATAGQTDFAADFPLLRDKFDAPTGVFVRRLRAGQAVNLDLTAFTIAGEAEGSFTVRLLEASQAGDQVQVFGRLPALRDRAHPPGGAVRTPTLEGDAIGAYAQLQEHARDLGRGVAAPLGEAGHVLPGRDDLKGRFLYGDPATGDLTGVAGIVNLSGSLASGGVVAAGGETKVQVGEPVSAPGMVQLYRNGVEQAYVAIGDQPAAYGVDGSSLLTLATAAVAGETFRYVVRGGFAADATVATTFTAEGGGPRPFAAILRESVRLYDYVLAADGEDRFPAFERIRAHYQGERVEIRIPGGDHRFLSGTITDDGFEMALVGHGYDLTRLLLPSTRARWVAAGLGVVESRNLRLMGLTLAADDDGAPPAGSVAVEWAKFNYGYEEDVRVMQRAIGRRWSHNGGSTSIRYQSWGCATDTCSEAYEDFGEVAGVYIFNHEYGRNSGEAYDVAELIRFRGGANDITHTDSQMLPRGPRVQRPDLMRFTEIVGATGIFNFNNCVTENVRFGAVIDAGVTVTALNINGGRYAPVAADFFSWGDAASRVQYSTFRPSQISNLFNLVNPYRCYVTGQFAAVHLAGGSGASLDWKGDVSGQLEISDAWDRLSVSGAAGSIADAATGTGLSIMLAGYVRLPGLPTSPVGLASGRMWQDGVNLKVAP